jgi:hypothetical protein
MKDNEAYNKTGLASAGRVIRNNVISDNFGGEDFAGSGIWVYTNRFDSQIKII